jgi:hypothetical protein
LRDALENRDRSMAHLQQQLRKQRVQHAQVCHARR